MFPISTHPTLFDKPASWHSAYAENWSSSELNLNSLVELISAGRAFIPAAMSSARRSSAAFARTALAVIDVDDASSQAQVLEHPRSAQACAIYTTCSHNPEQGRFRYRILFALPQTIEDPELYKALLQILIAEYGSDQSCSDPCRLFYGNSAATWPLYQPEALLDAALLEQAASDLAAAKASPPVDLEHDEATLERAIFCLEQIIPPTCDGQRDEFIRITAAAAAGGPALFEAWQQWASAGHHGKGKNAKQLSERFFRGFAGSSLGTLFFKASEIDPNWRSLLPEHLKSSGEWQPNFPSGAAGYSHDDLLEEDDPAAELPSGQDSGIFGVLQGGAPAGDSSPGSAAADGPDADDQPAPAGGSESTGDGDAPRRGRSKRAAGNDTISAVLARLRHLYPLLRLNVMNQRLEYGPPHAPQVIADISTAYVRISRGCDTLYGKQLVHDTAQVEAWENRYHPVKQYLEHCAAAASPCPYFANLASTLLGLPDDPILNPRLTSGRLLADVILERFLIGAVARVYEPGCAHDWIPILIGSQNVGKSTFFQYLTPDDPQAPGTYPWCATVQQGITYLKDRPHTLHAGWIVLLDEVERYFRRQFTEELKNLISTPIDRSARKYENERDFPRSFVMAGAANNTDFLVDPTGNRRFMPVMVKGVVPSREDPEIKIIDLDRLKADRDSIWAAAYQAYLAKSPHTFSSHELATMADYLDTFSSDSAIDIRLSRALETNSSGIWRERSYVTMGDIFQWLDLPLTSFPQMNLPIADALKRAGYQMARVSIAGKTRRIWMVGEIPPRRRGPVPKSQQLPGPEQAAA